MLSPYAFAVATLIRNVEVTDVAGAPLLLEVACGHFISAARATHHNGGKTIFVGNGGSAAIASHMAIDFVKRGGIRAVALNDAATLTCFGNDYGYETVFAKQIEVQARPKDVVVAISSSGDSLNIVEAARVAAIGRCQVATLSGFSPSNRLRSFGDINFYVNSSEYGLVEIAHLTILHAILDIDLGWGKTDA